MLHLISNFIFCKHVKYLFNRSLFDRILINCKRLLVLSKKAKKLANLLFVDDFNTIEVAEMFDDHYFAELFFE